MKRFDGFCTPKITRVNCGDNFLRILTFVVFVNKKMVSLSFYPPKQLNETQRCAMRQVEHHKQPITKHPLTDLQGRFNKQNSTNLTIMNLKNTYHRYEAKIHKQTTTTSKTTKDH